KELLLAHSPYQRHTRRSPPPGIRGLRPQENLAATGRIGGYHRPQQIMRQRVVIGPTGDAVEPGGKEPEFVFAIAKMLGLILKQENRHHFFFENAAGEKIVRDLDHEIQPPLALDTAPEAHREFS